MKPSVSSYIPSQLPEFIANENPVFVKLLQSYYEFLEQPENAGVNSPLGFLRNAIEQKDIDSATAVFKEHIKQQVLPQLPQNELTKIDANTLIKHIKELVSIKGTLESYQFAMRAIYEVDVTTQNMSDYVFRASDNEHRKNTILVLKNVPGDTTDLTGILGSSVIQNTPLAAAFIDDIQKTTINGVDYYTCTLKNETVFGDFIVGGNLSTKIRNTGVSLFVQLDHILGEVDISNPGTLYTPGQRLNLIGGTGVQGEVTIDEVTMGGVDECLIVKRGEDYHVNDTVIFTAKDGSGSGATGYISHVDGYGANLQPIMEVDTVRIKNAGRKYETNELIELILPGANTNPIVQVASITTVPSFVEIQYGGNYNSVNVLWIDGTNYYTLPCTVVNRQVTFVPLPNVTFIGTPTFYVGGHGASGSLVTTAYGTDSTFVGTVTLSSPGYNYTACAFAKFYLDAGFTQEVVVTEGFIKYNFTVDGTSGIASLTIDSNIRFKGVPAGTTIYIKIECGAGKGFVGSLFIGGEIATTSIYRRGTMESTNGDLIAYNVPTQLFGTSKYNDTAIFDVEYRVKDSYIADPGFGYNNSFNLTGFSTTSGLNTVDYPAGGLITNNVVKAGSLVTGAGIPANTHVLAIVSETQLTITNPATASAIGVTLTFGGTFTSLTGGEGSGAQLTPVIANGAVTTVGVTNGGTGYTANTTIQILNSSGIGAILKPVIVGGVITSVTIVDCGTGYSNTDTIVAIDTTGTGAVLTLTTSNGVIRDIVIMNGGQNYLYDSTAVITGDGTLATATITVTDGLITAVTLTNRGSGYTTASVNITNTATAATVTALATTNGEVSKVDIVNRGEGYWDPTEVTPLTITITDPTNPPLVPGGTGYVAGSTTVLISGDGTGATAVANIRPSDGKILSVTMTNYGTGYTYADVSFVGAGTGAAAVARIVSTAVQSIDVVGGKLATFSATINDLGVIDSLEILDPGFGYVTPPTITITGSGIGATVTSVTVDAITRTLTGFVLSGGSGYKYGTKITVSGDGSGAVLTPVVETGITKLEITNIGKNYTAPRALIYEGANVSAKVKLTKEDIGVKVEKFIGSGGAGTFAVGDIIYVGLSEALAVKKGVVVFVEGTTVNPIIHYYLLDNYPVRFSAGDFIQDATTPAASCFAGAGSGAEFYVVFTDGSITDVLILNPGSGYNADATIDFTNMDGVGARASITVNPLDSYKITAVTILDGGSGYTTKEPTITKWAPNMVVTLGEEVWYGEYQYISTNAGTTGTTAPTHTTGTVSDGAVNWTFEGHKGLHDNVLVNSNTKLESIYKNYAILGTLSSYEIDENGSGYVAPTTVVYNDPGSTELSVTLLTGAVNAINVTTNGFYASAPSVVIVGDGAGATAHTTLTSEGKINTVVVDLGGSGYTWAHAYLTDNVGQYGAITSTAERYIKSVTINAAGSGYRNIALSVTGAGDYAALRADIANQGSISSTAVTGTGSRYTTYPVISVIDESAVGSISAIKLLNSGSGYKTFPVVSFASGNKTAAVTAIGYSIGSIKGTQTTSLGYNYSEVPIISFPLNVITTKMTTALSVGELVYVDGYNYPSNDHKLGPHAYVVSVDLERNLVEMIDATDSYNLILSSQDKNFNIKTETGDVIVSELSNYIGAGSVIVGAQSGIKVKVLWENRAVGTISDAAVGKYKSEFVSNSGYLSNHDIVMQDSYQYHDYAYKMRTAIPIQDYENTIRKIVHPGGYKLFSELPIEMDGVSTVQLPTTDTGQQVKEVSYLILLSLYVKLFVSEFIDFIHHAQFLKISDVDVYTIDQLITGQVDLSTKLLQLGWANANTRVNDVIRAEALNTLTLTDVTVTGTIASVTQVSGGTGYGTLTTTATVNTTTGSGAELTPIVVNGVVVDISIVNYGSGYLDTDTITISGTGIGANFTLKTGTVKLTKATRDVGSWLTNSFTPLVDKLFIGEQVLYVHSDKSHVPTATDLYCLHNPTLNADLIASSTTIAGTYTWSADLVTVTSVAHGITDGYTVLLSFATGGLTGINGAYQVTVLTADTFTIKILGAGTAGNVSINKIYNNFTSLTSLTNVFASGTYTWAANVITVTSTGHGLKNGQLVVLNFTTGSMTTAVLWTITYVDANTFTVAYTGSGTGGNVTIEKVFGSRELT